MKMKSRDMIFIAIVVFVVGGLLWLSTRNKAKAMSPAPPEHLTAKLRDECLKCHDARVECTRCHKPPKEANALNLNAGQINELVAMLRRAN